jgi:hypothetical protein
VPTAPIQSLHAPATAPDGTVNAKGETIRHRVVVIGTRAWGHGDPTQAGERREKAPPSGS